MGVLDGSHLQHGHLARIEVGDREVQVHLLGVILAGPLGGAVVVDPLEGDGGACFGTQLHPLRVVGVRLGQRPAGEGGIELRECSRVRAIDGDELEARDRHHDSGAVRGPDFACGK